MDEATAAELQRLELLLLDPSVRKDRNQASALLAEDFVEIGASGRVWTRESALDFLSNEIYTPPQVEDFSCFWLGADVALITYRAVRLGDGGESVAKLRSSIWIRESKTWKMRFHQGTRAIQ